MPVSMSSADAKPDSNMRIADSRYGISSALTTKPARSWQRIVCLPSVFSANGRRVVDGLLGRRAATGTISTSFSTGTGLKKWMPMTWSGREVAMPSFMIGIELVLEARIASVPRHHLVEALEHLGLDLLVLDDGLDDELAVGDSPRSVVKRMPSR